METKSDRNSIKSLTNNIKDDTICNHPSYEQVMLDVNRCAGRLKHIRQCYLHRTDDDNEPPEDLTDVLEHDGASGNDDSEMDLTHTESSDDDDTLEGERLSRIKKDLKCQRRLKKKLAKLIVRLLIKKPDLHYYQGFHDVCLTYMTIYGDKLALEKLDKLVDSHFSQFMQPTMIETQEFLALIPIIIGLHRSKVQDFLVQAEVGTIFALSWTITWFSHVIPDEHDVVKIFNFLESIEDPHMILYVCAAIVIHKSDQLLELEREMSIVHQFLCQVPRKEKLPLKDLLDTASEWFKKWPPEVVKKKLSDYRRRKLQMDNYNLVQALARRFVPSLSGLIVAPRPRMAIFVFVIASALALNWDRWMHY